MKPEFNDKRPSRCLARLVRPSSDGCCHDCGRSGKYLLEVNLGGNWWHFKCAETEKEAAKWIKWRSTEGSECRILPNSQPTGRLVRFGVGSSPTNYTKP